MAPTSAASTLLSVAVLSAAAHHPLTTHAFVPPSRFSSKHVTTRRLTSPAPIDRNNNPLRSLQMATTAAYPKLEEEISAMSVKEIRRELESYGVSTKSFFEKGELVEALSKARKEEMVPIDNWDVRDTVSTSGDESSSSDSPIDSGGDASKKNGWFRNMVDQFNNSGSSGSGKSTRKERIEQEREKCKKLKVKELKKELESFGISTKSYFEKSDFERAVAEARVDGMKRSTTSGRYGEVGSKATEDTWNPSYKDVRVTKFDAGLLDGIVIDV